MKDAMMLITAALATALESTLPGKSAAINAAVDAPPAPTNAVLQIVTTSLCFSFRFISIRQTLQFLVCELYRSSILDREMSLP
mmetsp:Transcript_24592/g.41829  ORF Transcript_24592/g.41829 Transcript_24592/m.41829 type:complete len:83 (-) Transcript_24592:1089-1337(-)